MNEILKITRELWNSKRVMLRIAKYNNEQMYRNSYLGDFWHFADPLLQIGIMIMMFALRGTGNPNHAHATGLSGHITWIALGMVTYFFMQAAMLKSAKSIQSQVSLLSKMNFSLAAIPLTEIITELRRYFVMLIFVLGLIIFYMGVWPSFWWLQYAYYFFAMVIFLYSLSLVTSTITVLIPDFYNAYAAVLRVGMWISGVIIPITPPEMPRVLSAILQLNPMYYIIEGFRETLLENPVGFWENPMGTLIFWGMVIILLFLGAHIHLRFRKKFMDFI